MTADRRAHFFLALLLGCLGFLLVGCGPRASVQWKVMGVVDSTVVDEASGLAPSRRGGDLYWVNNDSGNDLMLIALSERGREIGQVKFQGLKRTGEEDWEDIDSFVLDGRPCLLIADCGDNSADRPFILFHVVEEPQRAQLSRGTPVTVPVLWTQKLVYPQGAKDCESVAVDPKERKVYFLTKRESTPTLYVAPLEPQSGTVTLTAVGRVPHLPQPDEWQATIPAPRGKYYGQPTGMDFSADGEWAVVLTYGNVALFHRAPGDTWGVALGRRPKVLATHDIPQAEAVCFEARGLAVHALGEGTFPEFFRGRWTPPASE